MNRGRKNDRLSLNGWLVVDKPANHTSAQIVGIVKRLTRAAKVGHAGTLDPMATGILPLAFGNATKTIAYIVDRPKSYRFTVRFGEERDTDDAEGVVTATSDRRPTRQEIEAALPTFRGRIMQVPCTYSAVKVDGERAYDLARDGQKVELEARPIDIFEFTLESIDENGSFANFTVTCGKGAYMRALARDLGRKLNCYGHLTMIRRTQVAGFKEIHAKTMDNIADLVHKNDLALLPIDTALDDIPAYQISEGQAKLLRNGQAVVVTNPNLLSAPLKGDDPLVRAVANNNFVALARMEEGFLVPLRVMQGNG